MIKQISSFRKCKIGIFEKMEEIIWNRYGKKCFRRQKQYRTTVNARFYVYPPKKKSDILYLVTDNPRTIVYNYFYTS